MKRIDSAGATEDNKFTEGDPATGTPATIVSAAWLNAVQEEIAQAIEKFGVTLDPEQDDQLAGILKVHTVSRVNGIPVLTVEEE